MISNQWVPRPGLLLLVALAGCALTGCDSSSTDDLGCASDGDCNVPGTRCDLSRLQCVCATDEACTDGYFCNVAGTCQRQTGCQTTDDCSAGTFCDLASGICLEDAGPVLGAPCGLASHCPFGTVCMNGQCAEGCFSDGDCTLGQICYDGFCNSSPAGQTVCSDSTFCEYGDVCESDNFCAEDNRGPYCRSCSRRSDQNPNPCDGYRNFCLINSRELGGYTNYCGVDCSEGQACPSGYGCSDVIVLTRSTCGSTADCRCQAGNITYATATCGLASACAPGENAANCVVEGAAACNDGVAGGTADCVVSEGQTAGNCTCRTDADCPNAGACVEGLCCTGTVRDDPLLECVGGEGRVLGYCTCATDDDCGRDSCDATSGSCLITGHPCTPGANDCPPIACIEGGCRIGRNCAPEQGLACSELTGS